MNDKREDWGRRTFVIGAAAASSASVLSLERVPSCCRAAAGDDHDHAEPDPRHLRRPSVCRRGASLRGEGFTDVRYAKFGAAGIYKALASGDVDLSMTFVAPFITQLDAGAAIVLLGGVHAGCFELFGTEGVHSIRDLKGKTVAIPELGSAHHVFTASMAAHVGLNLARDINFVIQPAGKLAQLPAEDKKVDALMGFPPVPQELRAKNIGHVIVSSGVDRPWSQYFCCIVGANEAYRSQASRGDETGVARNLEGGELLLAGTCESRSTDRRPRVPVRVRAPDDEGDSVRAVGRVRPRGHRAVLCPPSPRGGDD